MLRQGKNINSGFVRVRRVFYTIKLFLGVFFTFVELLEFLLHF